MCIISVYMAVKIEHTVAGLNHDNLQQCTFLMLMPAEIWGLKQTKNSQDMCFFVY